MKNHGENMKISASLQKKHTRENAFCNSSPGYELSLMSKASTKYFWITWRDGVGQEPSANSHWLVLKGIL